jgi:hypothetical protein
MMGWLLANLFLLAIVITGATATTLAGKLAFFFGQPDNWTLKMVWTVLAIGASVATYFFSAALHSDLQRWLSRQRLPQRKRPA